MFFRWKSGEEDFYISATDRNRLGNWRWHIVMVYGPADRAHSRRFLEELGVKCGGTVLPTIIGGDFNLVREESDKSNGVVDRGLMRAFNDFIGRFELREIHRGRKFTWTNKQDSPIMSNIDRVLVTTDWEAKFPMCSLTSLTRIGLDHNPIMLNLGGGYSRMSRFFFERQWNKMEGFDSLVMEKWRGFKAKCPPEAYSLDAWHGILANMRRFLKGWGQNVRGEYRRKRG
jgi:hypothetical protein